MSEMAWLQEEVNRLEIALNQSRVEIEDLMSETGGLYASLWPYWCELESMTGAQAIDKLIKDNQKLREALTYLVKRCESAWLGQDQPCEMDFVMLAVEEVRDKVLGDNDG
jgi:hypothetical protein